MLGLSLNTIYNTIRVKASGLVRKGLALFLPFSKSEIIGSELVVNGDFATDSDWTTGTGWSISGGDATFSGTDFANLQPIIAPLTIGNRYKVTLEAEVVEGSFKLQNNSVDIISESTSDTFVAYFTAASETFNIARASVGVQNEFSIDNISVKEVSQFAKDKSTNTNNAKLFTGKALSFDGVGDYVDLGSTLGLTGEFTIAFWVNLTNYTEAVIVGDSANQDWFRINSATDYTLKLNDGSSVAVVFGGSIPLDSWSRVVLIRDSNNLVTISVNGVIYTDNAPTRAGDFDFIYLGLKDSTRFMSGSLSDVQLYNSAWTQADVTFDYNNPQHLVTDNSASTIALSNLKGYWALSEGAGDYAYNSAVALGSEEVDNGDFATDDGWVKGAGWTISGGSANGSSTTGDLYQEAVTESGKYYKVTYTISNYDSGSVRVELPNNSAAGIERSANGTYTETLLSVGTIVMFDARTSFTGSIDNVSVKEISVGTINGATPVLAQATIPQLGLMDWAKSTVGSDEITLISTPADPSKDILDNDVRLREHAFNLDGSGYAEVPDADNLDFGTSAFTIQFWAKPSSIANNARMVTKGITGNGEWMISFSSNDNVRVFAKDSNGNHLDTAHAFATLSVNTWAMVTVVVDTPNNKILFYKDNQSTPTEDTGASWSGNFNNTRSLVVGDHYNGSTRLDGLIDDVRAYNKALSSDEVEQNFNYGITKHKNESAYSDDYSSDYGY